MDNHSEILDFLWRHLNSIKTNDIPTYHETTHEELTLYEWWITPHRIDGLGFHDFMMESNAVRGSVFGVEGDTDDRDQKATARFDLANLKIQHYGNTAIASYTLLISATRADSNHIASHNETRVIQKFPEGWKVVHVHKSPAWKAPHEG